MLSAIVANRLALTERPATPAFSEEDIVITCAFLLHLELPLLWGRGLKVVLTFKMICVFHSRDAELPYFNSFRAAG